MGNPEEASHYYGYMNGAWKDESMMTEGGTGFGGDISTKFMFPGNPSEVAWSECSSANTPADRRFLMSSDIGTLLPGQVVKYDYAAIWVDDVEGPYPDFAPIQSVADTVYAAYANCYSTFSDDGLTVGTFVQEINNDANDVIKFTNNNINIESNIKGDLTVYTIDGKLMTTHTTRMGEKQFNLMNLKNGIYIVKFENYARKIIVNH